MSKIDHKVFWVGALLLIILAGGLILNGLSADESSSSISGTMDVDNGDAKINWSRYETYDVELTENLNIVKAGIYHLTGSLEGGITIDVNDEIVKLILDNVTINNPSGPAIACYSADDLVVELVGTNTLSDGSQYDTSYDEDVNGAIYSKDDLSFTGDGSLILQANYQDGIVGKDDLTFRSGTYQITSVDDAIRGKDSVDIAGGSFAINAGADAIKSTNETDEGKGFILIQDGDFEITSVGKGIKAVNSILIQDGTFAIKSTDDSIHSNNYVGIQAGEITINSGDDGIHADNQLIIDGGKVVVTKSYEGLEAQKVTINGGQISLVTSDDGINAGGGADSSSMNRPGANPFAADEDCVLTFNGGEVSINAGGDGVDSNGMIYFNGGTVIVDGPTSSADGALDSGSSIVMNGGKVIAVGASGMAETLGESSAVYNASIYFTSTNAAGTTVTIKDADGDEVISHKSAKTFNHMSVGSEEFELGQTYTIYVDDVEYETFTIESIVTTVGSGNSFNSMPGNTGGGGGNMPTSPSGSRR